MGDDTNLDQTMNKPFDEPTKRSLYESKEFWEDTKEQNEEFLKTAETEDDKEGARVSIADAEENLKDIDARLTDDEHKEYWEGKKKEWQEFLLMEDTTEEDKQKFLSEISNAEEKLKRFH